jgi:hypothetical protein
MQFETHRCCRIIATLGSTLANCARPTFDPMMAFSDKRNKSGFFAFSRSSFQKRPHLREHEVQFSAKCQLKEQFFAYDAVQDKGRGNSRSSCPPARARCFLASRSPSLLS